MQRYSCAFFLHSWNSFKNTDNIIQLYFSIRLMHSFLEFRTAFNPGSEWVTWHLIEPSLACLPVIQYDKNSQHSTKIKIYQKKPSLPLGLCKKMPSRNRLSRGDEKLDRAHMLNVTIFQLRWHTHELIFSRPNAENGEKCEFALCN